MANIRRTHSGYRDNRQLIELLSPKPDRSLWYFEGCARHGSGAYAKASSVYLRGYGDFALSTLKLTGAKQAGPGTISWRAVSPEALDRACACSRSGGSGPALERKRFRPRAKPTTSVIQTATGWRSTTTSRRYVAPDDLRSTLKNLPQKFTGRGAAIRRTRPSCVACQDVVANRRFAEQLMGFQLRETILFERGTFELGSWLSPNAVHHQLAYVVDIKGASGRLHQDGAMVRWKRGKLQLTNGGSNPLLYAPALSVAGH